MGIFRLFVVVAFFCVFNSAQSQNFTLSGFVRDSLNGESIKGVQISESISGSSVNSNSYGFYSLTLTTYNSVGIDKRKMSKIFRINL